MTQTVQILFFGSLAEALNSHGENFPLKENPVSLAQLRASLAQRGGQWQLLLESNIKSAVNHEVVTGDCDINANDEIAFFPPVTGG